MNEKNLTQNEIRQKINAEDELNGICIIQNHENEKECVMYISDKLFTCGYKMEFNLENLNTVKKSVDEDVLVFVFTDKELQEAWIESYKRGGISEDRFDRRADFHPFNIPHELFCIDRNLLWHITDYWKGTPHEGHPKWMDYIIDWYKSHSI